MNNVYMYSNFLNFLSVYVQDIKIRLIFNSHRGKFKPKHVSVRTVLNWIMKRDKVEIDNSLQIIWTWRYYSNYIMHFMLQSSNFRIEWKIRTLIFHLLFFLLSNTNWHSFFDQLISLLLISNESAYQRHKISSQMKGLKTRESCGFPTIYAINSQVINFIFPPFPKDFFTINKFRLKNWKPKTVFLGVKPFSKNVFDNLSKISLKNLRNVTMCFG